MPDAGSVAVSAGQQAGTSRGTGGADVEVGQTDRACIQPIDIRRFDHPVVEAVLVRVSDLRKLPENMLIPRLLHHAEAIMGETETLHVSALITVIANEEVEL